MVRVVATCDPGWERMTAEIEKFRLNERGVAIYATLSELLIKEDLGAVTLPTPIPLHLEQHDQVVASGAGCYLEKPPTLWWPELEVMLSVEKMAGKSTHVGFNFIGDPFRRHLKRRTLNGEFGALRGVGFHAVWPRNLAYYSRNNWAGKLRLGDKWVLDSPVGNALAHYTQNVLFWCGNSGVDSVGEVTTVAADLSRAHPIESFDTAFIQVTTKEGPWIRIAMTHVGAEASFERETLYFERATIRFSSWRSAVIYTEGKEPEVVESGYFDQQVLLRDNLARYFSYLRGETERPITRVEDCRSFVALNSLATLSSGGIAPMESTGPDENGHVRVEGLGGKLQAFAENGVWPGPPPLPKGVGDLPSLANSVSSLFP